MEKRKRRLGCTKPLVAQSHQACHGAPPDQNSPVRPELLKNHYYLMRHGQSEANVQGIIVSDPAVGVEGFGLTDTGKAQAHEGIRSAGISPVRIISSDFKRARQTAEIASQLTGTELRLDARLRERFFGSYNGQSDEHYARVWEKDARNLTPGMNVELPDSVLSRALDVIAECEQAVQGTVLLVAHGDVCQILLAWAAGRAASEHRSLPHMQTAEIRRLNAGLSL